jgi:hypothetical protein
MGVGIFRRGIMEGNNIGILREFGKISRGNVEGIKEM